MRRFHWPVRVLAGLMGLVATWYALEAVRVSNHLVAAPLLFVVMPACFTAMCWGKNSKDDIKPGTRGAVTLSQRDAWIVIAGVAGGVTCLIFFGSAPVLIGIGVFYFVFALIAVRSGRRRNRQWKSHDRKAALEAFSPDREVR